MTTSVTRRRLEVRPVTSIIGAEIDGLDLREPLDADTVAELSEALVRWKVLFFRNQTISYDQQIAFAGNFGDVTPAHPIHPGLAEKPEMFVVDTRDAKAQFGHTRYRPQFAPPRLTAAGWHTDITFVANPALASILRGAVVPPFGGDTLWTNLVAAYEDLSEPIRDLVDGLHAVHRWHGYNGETREGYDPDQPPPAAVHPVVRVHPVTGERALFVNPVFTRYIVGLSDRENKQILDLLFGQLAASGVHGAVPVGDRQRRVLGQPVDRAPGTGRPRVERLRPSRRAGHHRGRPPRRPGRIRIGAAAG